MKDLILHEVTTKTGSRLEARYHHKGRTFKKTVKNKKEAIQWRQGLFQGLGLVDTTGMSLETLIKRYTEVKDGVLVWTINDVSGYKAKGAPLGSGATSKGYRQITLHGSVMAYHRAIWLSHYGAFPKNQIDHINHDKTDNRIENLRDVTAAQNLRNKSKQKNNTSGYTGVRVKTNKSGVKIYMGVIKVNRKTIYLGSSPDLNRILKLRREAEIKYGFSDTHGKINSK